MPIKLKTIIESLQQEADLSGYSRSGGKPSWDHYVVPNFDASKIYVAEKDAPIYDVNQNQVGSIKKGEELTILSTELQQWRGKFAAVKIRKEKNDLEGYMNINSIRKPTSKKAGAIGDVTSKEFLPTKLGLVGVDYESPQQLIEAALAGLERSYGDSKYDTVRDYLTECMYILSGDIHINETNDIRKNFKLSKAYSISNSDIGILSKNFGEVLAAVHILATGDKVAKVYFPNEANSPLYDFVMVKTTGMNEYYSVKSHGGSSTSAENLNFLLKSFDEKNELFEEYADEIEVIKSIINDKSAGRTTLTNILSFFETRLPDKTKAIIEKLNSISKHKIRSLDQRSLSDWFKDVVNNATEDDFVKTLQSIYTTILNDMHKTPSTTEVVLRKFFKDKFSKDNGYLYYPMGAYIKEYLNDPTKPYLKVLNILLNYGTYIHQFDVNLYADKFDVRIGSFAQKKFRFDYNGMSNAPANRPLGFKEASH